MKLLREFKIGTILLITLVISIQSLMAQEAVPSCMVSIPKKDIINEYNNVSSLPKQQQYAVFVAAVISLTTTPDSSREILNKMPDPFVRPRDLYPPAESKPKTSNFAGEIPPAFASIADVGAPAPTPFIGTPVTSMEDRQSVLNYFWKGYKTGASARLMWWDPSFFGNDISGQIRGSYDLYMRNNGIDSLRALAYGYHFGLQELTNPDKLNLKPTIPCLDWYHYVKNNNIRTIPPNQ